MYAKTADFFLLLLVQGMCSCRATDVSDAIANDYEVDGPISVHISKSEYGYGEVLLRCTAEGRQIMNYFWINTTNGTNSRFDVGAELNMCDHFHRIRPEFIQCMATNNLDNNGLAYIPQGDIADLREAIDTFCGTSYMRSVVCVFWTAMLFLVVCPLAMAAFDLSRDRPSTAAAVSHRQPEVHTDNHVVPPLSPGYAKLNDLDSS